MTLLIILGIALLVVGTPLALWGINGDGGLRFTAWMVAGISLLAGIIFLCVAVAVGLDVRNSETTCERIGVQTERDVRFVRYTSFSWDCLTPSSDGWVSIDKVIKTEGDS